MSHPFEIGPRASSYALREALREEERLRQAGAMMAGAFVPGAGEQATPAAADHNERSMTEVQRSDAAVATPDGERAAGRRDKVRNDLIDGS